MIKVTQVARGARNVTVRVTGVVNKELEMTPIELGVAQLKLSSLVWLIQEKLGLYLWWNKDVPLLPMESRNSVRFDSSITSPEGWDGKIWLSSFNFSVAPVVKEKWFFLVLDFDK